MIDSSYSNHKDGKFICDDNYVFSDKPIKNKEIILHFLKSFTPSWYTSARVSDTVSGESVEKCNNIYFDGVYEWTEEDIYHFETYNLQLDETFVQYVLENKA